MLPEGWKQTTVGNACAIKNNLRLPISTEQRSGMHGPYPYFGPTGVLGYLDHYRINEEFALIGEDGDHFLKFKEREMTLYFSGKANVNNHAHIVGNSSACLAKWFHYTFMHCDLTPVLSRQGVGRYKLTKSGLENLKIILPSIAEQEQIITVLATWDDAIAATQKLVANTRQQKRALMQQLLSGKRRLKQFARSDRRVATRFGSLPVDWEHVAIERVANEFSAKNVADEPLPVLSCTKHAGLVDSLAYFNKRIFSEDTTTYKIVERNCFAYATNHIDEGSIGYQNLYDKALISPMYTVFKTSGAIDDGFLFKLLKTEHYRQIFAANTNASVDRRGSLRWGDFKKIEIPLPSLQEQAAISAVIDVAEQEISSLEKQLAVLREEKRALMQQLLTGKRRVRVSVCEEETSAS
ncbi:restriction endonuclease subunit S [Aromatoleum evansii]|uniref:Restriction endonuclease subunit S n=1 Tax=Aromatoleum evansii TaxID=59406 RepID=A0ABZ1AKR4_AROEV|nr:restriction endonuclease subunit S [Aromatoleum evansii]